LSLNSGPSASTTEPLPLALFALVMLSDGTLHFCLGLATDHDPLPYASCIAGITDVCTWRIRTSLGDLVLPTTGVFLLIGKPNDRAFSGYHSRANPPSSKSNPWVLGYGLLRSPPVSCWDVAGTQHSPLITYSVFRGCLVPSPQSLLLPDIPWVDCPENQPSVSSAVGKGHLGT
jgi:hypothetical protein